VASRKELRIGWRVAAQQSALASTASCVNLNTGGWVAPPARNSRRGTRRSAPRITCGSHSNLARSQPRSSAISLPGDWYAPCSNTPRTPCSAKNGYSVRARAGWGEAERNARSLWCNPRCTAGHRAWTSRQVVPKRLVHLVVQRLAERTLDAAQPHDHVPGAGGFGPAAAGVLIGERVDRDLRNSVSISAATAFTNRNRDPTGCLLWSMAAQAAAVAVVEPVIL